MHEARAEDRRAGEGGVKRRRAAGAGYTHVLLSDSRSSKFGDVERFAEVAEAFN